ncbi:hypothetical protein CCACVL1_03465, partial [Corchorus capsularis]
FENLFSFLALTDEFSRLDFFGLALRPNRFAGGASIAVASGCFNGVVRFVFKQKSPKARAIARGK